MFHQNNVTTQKCITSNSTILNLFKVYHHIFLERDTSWNKGPTGISFCNNFQ